ncbi:MAG: sterol desaturase family protein [Polyangiaceae bacterium]
MVDLTAYAIPFFVIAMLLEGFVLFKRGTPYGARDTAASLSGGIGVVIIGIFWKIFEFAALSWVFQFRFFDPGTGVLGWTLMFFADDFAYYWYHRVGHEIRLFWAAHVPHHSSQRYTRCCAPAILDSTLLFTGFPFWLWLPLLGLRPEMIIMMKAISLIYQFWIHTSSSTGSGHSVGCSIRLAPSSSPRQ